MPDGEDDVAHARGPVGQPERRAIRRLDPQRGEVERVVAGEAAGLKAPPIGEAHDGRCAAVAAHAVGARDDEAAAEVDAGPAAGARGVFAKHLDDGPAHALGLLG